MRIWEKSFLGSKIYFKKKEKKEEIKKKNCKTILLAVRRQSVIKLALQQYTFIPKSDVDRGGGKGGEGLKKKPKMWKCN